MKAFTLVELLAATLIMCIIIAAVSVAFSVGQSSWFTGDTAIELRAQTIQAVITMDKELSATRPSKINLAIGESNSTVTFYLPQDNDADGIVVDSLGDIEWSGAITYSLNASNQIIRSLGENIRVLANDITNLIFTRTQDKLIQVDITAQATTPQGRQLQDVEQAIIKMRN